MEVLEQLMVVGIDREHGEAQYLFTCGLAFAGTLARDPYGLAISALDACEYRVAASPIRFVDGLHVRDSL